MINVFTYRELCTILAALELYQRTPDSDRDPEHLANDGYSVKPLSYEEIAELSKRVDGAIAGVLDEDEHKKYGGAGCSGIF